MRRLVPLLLAIGLAAYAVGGVTVPRGGEATPTLAAASLWHDRDLAFGADDLARGYRLWDDGPRGLVLASHDGGPPRFATAPLYPLLLSPWVAAWGVAGGRVLQVVLLAGIFGCLLRLRPSFPRWGVAALLVSGTGALLWRNEAGLLAGLLVLLPLVLVAGGTPGADVTSRPGRAAVAGLAAGLLVAVEPLLLPAALVPAALLVYRDRRGLAALLGVGALVVLASGWWSWPAAAATPRQFDGPFPGERGGGWEATLPAGVSVVGEDAEGAGAALLARAVHPGPPPSGRRDGDGWLPSWRLAARNLRDLLIGRHAGLLAMFPGLLLLLGGADRGRLAGSRAFRWGVGAPVAGLLVGFTLVAPYGWQGGANACGSRPAAALLPLALVLLPARPRRSLAVAAAVAATLWTVPSLLGGLAMAAPGEPGAVSAQRPLARLLPRELGLLATPPADGFLRLETGAQPRLWVLPGHAYGEEGSADGFWLRPNRRSELFLLTPGPLERLDLWVSGIAAAGSVELASGGESVLVRFDTAGKRRGAKASLPARPIAQGLGVVFGAEERIYRLVAVTGPGAVPMRLERAGDQRALGAFIATGGLVSGRQ